MDIHCWIQLDNGTIFDPTPIANQQSIFLIRGIDDDKRFYSPYSNDNLRKATKDVFAMIKHVHTISQNSGTSKDQYHNGIRFNHYSEPSNCIMNCFHWLLDNKGKGKMIIGKMGWKTKSGNIWWEFG